MKFLGPVESAYLSAAFDILGKIKIRRIGRKGKYDYEISLCLESNNHEILEILMRKTGIGMLHDHQKKFVWVINDTSEIEEITTYMEPSSILQKEKLKIIQEFITYNGTDNQSMKTIAYERLKELS